MDTDGDGLLDTELVDLDSNGVYDVISFDSDGDGNPDIVAFDQDENGIADYISMDTDGDGIFDTVIFDDNQDGVADYIKVDTDGDGLLDTVVDSIQPMHQESNNEVDLDGDGIADGISFDSDGDGYAESVKMDTDGDGIVDTIVSDTDGDGKIDTVFVDTDGDGVVDTIAIDQDGDGNADTILFDKDGDGIAETIAIDKDGDGIFETMGIDVDKDGVIDTTLVDTDRDGIYDTQFDASKMDNIDNRGQEDYEIANAEHGGYYENGIYYPPTFDRNAESDYIAGDPAAQMENWHLQETDSTCAVACQEFVLEFLTGKEYTEDELREIAEEHGWYDRGTAIEDVGKILEHEGITVEREWNEDISDIEEALAKGDCVIVALDADEIWTDDHTDLQLEDMYAIPGTGADHAVQVIGIDRTDPDNPMVILNDSGHPGGCGAMIPLDQFIDAWEDSGFFACYAYANN